MNFVNCSNIPYPSEPLNSLPTGLNQASVEEQTDSAAVAPDSSARQQPIPPPSSPKQYRAIGLIKGQYQFQEQMTRGVLTTAEGTAIEAVLLGRVISLIKNHLDLEQEHLWVVYPRTRQESDQLHVQIVGVWEPETLASESPQLHSHPENGYFSVRGEVVYCSQEKETVIVKIRQSPKRDAEKPKFFKVKLQGTLPDKPVNHFWDLQVQLQGQTLVIQEATDMGLLPRKKPFRRQGRKPEANRRSSSRLPTKKAAPPKPNPNRSAPKPIKNVKKKDLD